MAGLERVLAGSGFFIALLDAGAPPRRQPAAASPACAAKIEV